MLNNAATRPTAGAAIAVGVAENVPPPFFEQLRLLCRRAGLIALQDQGPVNLEAVIGAYGQQVRIQQGWSLGDVVDIATGRALAAPTEEGEYRDIRSRYLAAVCAVELVNGEQQVDFGEASAIARRVAAANYRLVVSIARRIRPMQWLRFADVVQEGFIGLLKAIDAYDPYRGYRLTTYATWWIRQAIMRAGHDSDRMIRLPVHVGEGLHRVRASSSHVLLSPSNIAQELGITEQIAARILSRGPPARPTVDASRELTRRDRIRSAGGRRGFPPPPGSV